MKRIVTYLALLAMLANNASAGVLVATNKTVTNNAQGFDVWEVTITGYDGADNVAGNVVQGLDGTFAATTGFMSWADGDSDEDGLPDETGMIQASTGNTLASGGRGLGVGSWVNFRLTATVPGNVIRTGDQFTATQFKLPTWFTNVAAQKLSPTDNPATTTFRENLLATVFVTTGTGSATFTGTTGTSLGGTAPLTFTVGSGGGGPTTDPIAVTAVPASGTSRTVGQTVAVTNAAAVAPNARDAATISGTAVTTNAGSAGVFSAPGISNGALNAGSTQTATVGFNGAGLLNGFVANGKLHFDVASGAHGAGSGAGAYDYPLTATVAGNVGDGTAPVPVNGSYAALGSTSGLANNGALVHIPSTATILAGTNNVGGATTVSMVWSLRGANEQFPGGTTPPLPSFAYALTSDKVDITGIDDKFVLQMSYDPSLLTGNELDDFNSGKLFLASFDGTKWVNTVLLNSDGGAGATKVNGAWSGQTALSTWGADLTNNVVWAVVDHNSLFASVPEPSTIIIGLMGLVGLVGFARRRRG